MSATWAPPGISRVVAEAVLDATEGHRIDGADDQRRIAFRITRRVVDALEARWPEILRAELGRVVGGLTSPGRWDARRWRAAGIVARHLPASVVGQTLKRVMIHYDPDPDMIHPSDVRFGDLVRVWNSSYPGCA